jgi:hypothetical protein
LPPGRCTARVSTDPHPSRWRQPGVDVASRPATYCGVEAKSGGSGGTTSSGSAAADRARTILAPGQDRRHRRRRTGDDRARVSRGQPGRHLELAEPRFLSRLRI